MKLTPVQNISQHFVCAKLHLSEKTTSKRTAHRANPIQRFRRSYKACKHFSSYSSEQSGIDELSQFPALMSSPMTSRSFCPCHTCASRSFPLNGWDGSIGKTHFQLKCVPVPRIHSNHCENLQNSVLQPSFLSPRAVNCSVLVPPIWKSHDAYAATRH